MLELIRTSSVPVNVLRSAAKGALSVPPAEMLEILVLLTRNPVVGEDARLTLAGWDEAACRAALLDPNTSAEVLNYFASPKNLRVALLPSLVENPSVSQDNLLPLASSTSREVLDVLLKSPRVREFQSLWQALQTNPVLMTDNPPPPPAPSPDGTDVEAHTAEWLAAHAAEIAAEEGKAFELVDGTSDEIAVVAGTGAPAAAAAAVAPAPEEELEKVSTITRIARMRVGERVQLAMKGNKDERYILIRDGSKVVSGAVLASPKLTDPEVETFAGMKNVQESVLREIARQRKFVKNYNVVKNLINNPRTPLDVALALMKNVLVNDLKAVSMNKNISETLRKLASKMYKEKSLPPGAKKDP
jgi:hypothetical protein